MFVIATAGHIDHGKSTLIEALTGMQPDRRKEEQERGMTIDLGFAHLTLPSGREVGFVDVPGHHRFVKNMLAGVGAVDAVMFVVAATESWMPQSQEHLEIVDLLGVRRGVIVITKVDLADDEWIDMVEEEIREHVQGTVLEQAPVLRVSAVTGGGLDVLKAELDRQIDQAPEPQDIGRPRLWIDRVFSVKGAGTVVTGTLAGGGIALDDELQLLPSEKLVRVRGLQTYGKQVDAAVVGRRLAVNLAGVYVEDVERGDALVAPDQMRASERFNVFVRAVASLGRPLKRESALKIYVGTAERMARVKLLDREALGPGEEALAQVQVDRALAVQWNDSFVLRDPAHQTTIAGGKVLAPAARRVRGRDHRYRERSEVHRVLMGERDAERLDLELLRARVDASATGLIEAHIAEHGWLDRRMLQAVAPFPMADLEAAVGELVADNRLHTLPTYLVSAKAWVRLRERVESSLAAFHKSFPLRRGLPRETLRSTLGVDWRLFDELVESLEHAGVLVTEGARVRATDHEVRFAPAEQQVADRIMEALSAAPFAPPSIEEVVADFSAGVDVDEIVGALVEQGRLVRVGKELLFTGEAIDDIRRKAVEYLKAHATIDVGVLRDLLRTTRKYAVPLLEHLDQMEVTRRLGDSRVLGPKAAS